MSAITRPSRFSEFVLAVPAFVCAVRSGALRRRPNVRLGAGAGGALVYDPAQGGCGARRRDPSCSVQGMIYEPRASMPRCACAKRKRVTVLACIDDVFDGLGFGELVRQG
jgi:hypothetical protein